MLGYRLDGPVSIPGVVGVEIFLHSFVSRLVLSPLSFLYNEYQGLSPGEKVAKLRASHTTSS